MRTYISTKYSFISSWISLVFGSVFVLIGLAIFCQMVFSMDFHLGLFPLVPIALGLAFYRDITARIIYIEDDKIVAKGIFKTDIFDILDFKQVTREWWGMGGSFWIYFSDGRSFYFYPGWSFLFFSSRINTANEINGKINSIKDRIT